MILRPLTVALLLAALLSACSAPAAQEPERPFQVTPAPATPDPGAFSGPSQGGAYPAPNPAGSTGYPAPQAGASTDGAYPAPDGAPAEQTFGRSVTALDSLSAAEAVARAEFSSAARLHAIMPSRVMISNIGGPPVQLGWFYKFKVEGSPREFIVQVVDGNAIGDVETEPIRPPEPAELALPLDTIAVDSDQVYAQLTQRAAQLGISVTDPRDFDLELVNLQGSAGPVWSVFNPNGSRWLFSINATSGEETQNPRG